MKSKGTKKEKKVKQQVSLLKKMIRLGFAIAIVGAGIYFTYYLFHYMLYNRYRDFLTSYEVPEGRPYQPLSDDRINVSGFDLVAENEYLKLYTNPETADVAVYDKRNGEIFYSNPPGADHDAVANNVNINYLKSQFILTYFNRQVRTGVYDSYSMSVERGQFESESIADGVRYVYRIGELPKINTGTVPLYLHEDKIAELAAQMEERNGIQFGRIYVSSDLGPGIRQINASTLGNITTLNNMQSWLDAIGWTDEDFMAAMEIAGDAAVENVPISFDVALDYRLEGDSLVVQIPASKIKSYGGGSIFNIQLLRYMGAADTEETGYMVVPNGSGSLIYFNNGKQNYPIYQQSIYGMDPLIETPVTTENLDSAKLPIFGICRENNSILATIEEGRSLSAVSAAVSGTFNEYNYAYPTFLLGSADNLFHFGGSSIDTYVREPDIYDVNLTVRYSFLTEEDSGYDGLANYYRNRLFREGKLTRMSEMATKDVPVDIPFYYDVLGGVKETHHFLGTKYLRVFPMTTFREALKMSEILGQEGITNQVMNYQGWFNGGYYHNATRNVNLTGKLGSKKDFEALSAGIEKSGGRFYADVAFQHVTFADRVYNYNAVSSRYYGLGFASATGQVHPTMLWSIHHLGNPETIQHEVSPRYLPRYVETFKGKMKRYDIGGISLRDLSNVLHSDKRRSNIIHREDALSVVLAQFDLLNRSEKNLMGDSSFDYSFPYLADIINAPIRGNAFFIIDADIPLYEMIIHGSIGYSSPLLNFNEEEDKTRMVLNLIEYGASPHYVFTWEDANRMKSTGLNRYFNTTFDIWKAEAALIYSEVNDALKYVSGALMTGHDILSDDVRAVSYSNGVTIYINYGSESETVYGNEILPMSYYVIFNY